MVLVLGLVWGFFPTSCKTVLTFRNKTLPGLPPGAARAHRRHGARAPSRGWRNDRSHRALVSAESPKNSSRGDAGRGRAPARPLSALSPLGSSHGATGELLTRRLCCPQRAAPARRLCSRRAAPAAGDSPLGGPARPRLRRDRQCPRPGAVTRPAAGGARWPRGSTSAGSGGPAAWERTGGTGSPRPERGETATGPAASGHSFLGRRVRRGYQDAVCLSLPPPVPAVRPRERSGRRGRRDGRDSGDGDNDKIGRAHV